MIIFGVVTFVVQKYQWLSILLFVYVAFNETKQNSYRVTRKFLNGENVICSYMDNEGSLKKQGYKPCFIKK